MSIDKRVAGLIVMILVGFGFAGFFFMVLRENINNPTSPATNQNTSVPAQPTTAIPNEQAGWRSYSSNSLGININYPPLMKSQEHDDGSVTFILAGPTPADDKDFFNGIILNVKKASHESSSLASFVESERDRYSKESITEAATQVSEKTYGGKEGLEYTITALADFRYFYIEKGPKDYILLTMLVSDKQNAGYEDTVNQMIASLSY